MYIYVINKINTKMASFLNQNYTQTIIIFYHIHFITNKIIPKISTNPLNPFLKGGLGQFFILTYGNGMCIFTSTIIMVSKNCFRICNIFPENHKKR